MKALMLSILIIAAPVDPGIKYQEPKVVRQNCTHQTFDRVCIPRIKKVEREVKWI